MIEPRYLPLIGYADAWSASTKGELVAAPVFVGDRSPDDIAAMASSLKGAIVMTQPILTNFVRKDWPQPSDAGYEPMSAAYATSVGNQGGRGAQSAAQRMAQAVRDAGAAVIVKPSIGEHGTVFVTGRVGGPETVPSVTLAAEHYNMIAAMMKRNIPVKLSIHVQTRFYDTDGGNAYNVVADLPGVDPSIRDEVVMIGGHLDSWHTGVGATRQCGRFDNRHRGDADSEGGRRAGRDARSASRSGAAKSRGSSVRRPGSLSIWQARRTPPRVRSSTSISTSTTAPARSTAGTCRTCHRCRRCSMPGSRR